MSLWPILCLTLTFNPKVTAKSATRGTFMHYITQITLAHWTWDQTFLSDLMTLKGQTQGHRSFKIKDLNLNIQVLCVQNNAKNAIYAFTKRIYACDLEIKVNVKHENRSYTHLDWFLWCLEQFLCLTLNLTLWPWHEISRSNVKVMSIHTPSNYKTHQTSLWPYILPIYI